MNTNKVDKYTNMSLSNPKWLTTNGIIINIIDSQNMNIIISNAISNINNNPLMLKKANNT
jgi:predicted Kef-type K+ transport protein